MTVSHQHESGPPPKIVNCMRTATHYSSKYLPFSGVHRYDIIVYMHADLFFFASSTVPSWAADALRRNTKSVRPNSGSIWASGDHTPRPYFDMRDVAYSAGDVRRSDMHAGWYKMNGSSVGSETRGADSGVFKRDGQFTYHGSCLLYGLILIRTEPWSRS